MRLAVSTTEEPHDTAAFAKAENVIEIDFDGK